MFFLPLLLKKTLKYLFASVCAFLFVAVSCKPDEIVPVEEEKDVKKPEAAVLEIASDPLEAPVKGASFVLELYCNREILSS